MAYTVPRWPDASGSHDQVAMLNSASPLCPSRVPGGEPGVHPYMSLSMFREADAARRLGDGVHVFQVPPRRPANHSSRLSVGRGQRRRKRDSTRAATQRAVAVWKVYGGLVETRRTTSHWWTSWRSRRKRATGTDGSLDSWVRLR